MTVPPGVRHPAYQQHFETIETRAPEMPVEVGDTVDLAAPRREREERQDIAVIGPIAALVLALTISTLILEHPAARAVAAGLATVGLVVAVVLMLLGKRPEPAKHVIPGRHRMDR
ncbi:hypothetical protein ABZ345_09290 [Lentzea sp. NPDC005914]|uniref:hypothetical protein n=1 Tax=Lentzea sp. NPDC005914 TaxID=3154572 RepID=UPI0033DB10E5